MVSTGPPGVRFARALASTVTVYFVSAPVVAEPEPSPVLVQYAKATPAPDATMTAPAPTATAFLIENLRMTNPPGLRGVPGQFPELPVAVPRPRPSLGANEDFTRAD